MCSCFTYGAVRRKYEFHPTRECGCRMEGDLHPFCPQSKNSSDMCTIASNKWKLHGIQYPFQLRVMQTRCSNTACKSAFWQFNEYIYSVLHTTQLWSSTTIWLSTLCAEWGRNYFKVLHLVQITSINSAKISAFSVVHYIISTMFCIQCRTFYSSSRNCSALHTGLIEFYYMPVLWRLDVGDPFLSYCRMLASENIILNYFNSPKNNRAEFM